MTDSARFIYIIAAIGAPFSAQPCDAGQAVRRQGDAQEWTAEQNENAAPGRHTDQQSASSAEVITVSCHRARYVGAAADAGWQVVWSQVTYTVSTAHSSAH